MPSSTRGEEGRRHQHARPPARGAPDLRAARAVALADRGRRPGGAASASPLAEGACPPSVGPVLRGARMAARWGRRRSRGGANQILDLETGTVRREARRSSTRGGPGPQRGRPVGASTAGTRTGSGSGMSHGPEGPRMGRWQASDGLLHPDSRALIIARGEDFSFWDVETLRPIRRFPREVAHYPWFTWRSRRIAGSWPWRWRRASST